MLCEKGEREASKRGKSEGDENSQETGTTLRVLAEVTSGEGEDGRVDGGFEEEDDEESSSSDGFGVGESGDDGEETAHGSPDRDDGGRGEESNEGNRGETSDHAEREKKNEKKLVFDSNDDDEGRKRCSQGDLHVREHLRGRSARVASVVSEVVDLLLS
jgi:hypothetical protein